MADFDSTLTQQHLKTLLDYNPDTGLFTWKSCGGPRQRLAGKVTETVGDQGYVRIRIDGKRHPAHRLAWLYVYGNWPKNQIDHIDGNRSNNRISNLRDVSNSVNLRNMHNMDSRNKHGFAGVSKSGKKWMAQIKITPGKNTYLGSFPSPESAHQAYLAAKRVHHLADILSEQH